MVVIRLTRVGKKNSPAYRVVVAEKRRAVKRKFIEVLGHYNPISKPKEIVIDKERALFWISQGAMPSDTVRNLMADLDIIKKSDKVKKVYGKEKKKKEMKEGASKPAVAVAAEAEAKEDEKAPESEAREEVAETPAETIADEAPEAPVVEDTPTEEVSEAKIKE